MRLARTWTLTLMLITLTAPISALTIPYESWMGAYVGEKKVGYLCYKIEKAEYEGIPGYRIASVLNNRLTVLGVELTQLVNSVVNTDEEFNPLFEDFAMTSGGKTTRVRGTIKKDTIECVISAGSGQSTQSVKIPEGASLVGDAMFALVDKTPEVGKEYRLHYFNPLTLSVDELMLKVDRKEKIKVNGDTYDTVVLLNTTPMGDMTIWQVPASDIIQVHAMMGIKMVKQDRDVAMAGIESGTQEDFAVLTSVKPNVAISSPRKTRSLDIVLDGLSDPKMVLSDSRQKAAPVDGKPAQVRFTIAADTFRADRGLGLPIARDGFADCLASTPYLDCDVQSVKTKARDVVGSETNAYNACARIRKWVYANLQTRADIGITRAASDVLKSKVGVCRDYAILFAAMARGAGVPSRVVSGLLYTDGAFYYHAWVECYVGQWVPFDATMPSDYVDATHIKLAEGDATTMFALAKVIGSLRADVKDYK